MIVEKIVERWNLAEGQYFAGVVEERLRHLKAEGREIVSVSHAFLPDSGRGLYCSAIIVASGERPPDSQYIHERSMDNLNKVVNLRN